MPAIPANNVYSDVEYRTDISCDDEGVVPGWFFFHNGDPIGPFESKKEAQVFLLSQAPTRRPT